MISDPVSGIAPANGGPVNQRPSVFVRPTTKSVSSSDKKILQPEAISGFDGNDGAGAVGESSDVKSKPLTTRKSQKLSVSQWRQAKKPARQSK